MRITERKKKDLSGILERKIYLAHERPDELYDLSSCSLDLVPNGTFAMIKVLNKTQLFLQNNDLQNLDSGGRFSDLSPLIVLNLAANKFTQLPDGLKHLVSLQVLNLSGNQLQSLPSALFSLQQLRVLNVEDNSLRELPPEIGELGLLRELLLAKNPLISLPRQLSRLNRLEILTVPLETIRFPPKDVCVKGAVEVVRFLGGVFLQSSDNPYGSCQPSLPEVIEAGSCWSTHSCPPKLNITELERGLLEFSQAQAKLVSSTHQSRQKVLSEVTQAEAQLHEQLAALQRRRDENRSELISSLLTEEELASNLINQVSLRQASARQRELIEDAHYTDFLNKCTESVRLRKQEILESMQKMLLATTDAFRSHMSLRQAAFRSAEEEDSTTKSVSVALANRQLKQQDLINEILHELDAQKQAFAKLQFQRDTQVQRLSSDMIQIEQELHRLTVAEQRRKTAATSVTEGCLAERRTELARLLSLLNQQQSKRQMELQKRLLELEKQRTSEHKDYWLIQYQRLLDAKPVGLSDAVDVDLEKILIAANGLEFLPNFQYNRISYPILLSMTDEDLSKIGVHSLGVRRAILEVATQTKLSKSGSKTLHESTPFTVPPSAPPLPEEPGSAVKPSAPPDLIARIESECCICQNAQCVVVFLPCGHVCSCDACAVAIFVCPLCRATVSQKMHLRY